MLTRETYFAGSFYPDSAEEILRYIKTFDEIKSEHLDLNPRALIVPHAGYIYSGFTANLAFMQVPSTTRRVIVMGPSHRVAFQGTSIGLQAHYETPLGALSIDTAYARTLQDNFNLSFEPALHKEHSTEVQMPFIKHYLPDAKVIEMVYGQEEPASLARIISHLLRDENNLVVISTDLSHFYSEEDAHKLDSLCIEAIEKEEIQLLHQGCEACGKIGMEAVLLAAKSEQLQTKVLDYRTSAWASADTSRVVGYTSAIIY